MSTWGGADVAGENIEIVKRIYAAFGEKDRPAILALLAPDIVIRQSPVVPWGGEYHGHEGALQFFGKLVGTVGQTAAAAFRSSFVVCAAFAALACAIGLLGRRRST